MSSASVIGMGMAVPHRVERNTGGTDAGEFLAIAGRADLPEEAASAMGDARERRRAQTLRRHVIDDGEDPSDLEARAAVAAMQDAGVSAAEVDLVLVASLPSDRFVPTNGPAIQAKCGLENASAWGLDVGCASVPAQLVAATSLIHTGFARNVLIVQSQIGSRTVSPQSSNFQSFGDGAAAAIIGPVSDGYGLLGSHLRTDGSFRDGIVLAPSRNGAAARDWWHPCDGPPVLATFAPDLAKLAGVQGPEFCRQTCLAALAASGLSTTDVDLFVCNQSMEWFADACRRALGIPQERCIQTFEEHANIGAAAIIVNLLAAKRAGKLARGSIVLVYSPAAGFTRAAAVLRWWQ